MKRALSLIFLAIFTLGVGAQAPVGFDLSNYGVKIEPDKRLIVVLASLDMAATKNADGKFESILNLPLSPEGVKFREQLLADNVDLPADLRQKIVTFVASHKKRHSTQTDTEIVAPFISMAYTLTPAPEMNDPVVTTDLPGSLLDVLDFAPLVREFYRRSTISSKLDEYIKQYRVVADSTLKTSSREMVSDMLDYLHTRPQLIFSERVKVETTKGSSQKKTVGAYETRQHDRHFYIVPEMMAPKGTLNFLNVRDDYYLIVPPDTDLSGSSDARRTYLRFVIDPLVLAHSKDIEPMREWGKQSLTDLRKTDADVSPDVFLAISRSLVAAVDLRVRQVVIERLALQQAQATIATFKTNEEKKEYKAKYDLYSASLADEATQQLYEEYLRGAIFVFEFYEDLKGLETSSFDIAGSLQEMFAGFDSAKAAGRLESTVEARRRALAVREARKKPQDSIFSENPVTRRLLDIQKKIDAGDLTQAAADLKQLLAQYPSEPRIYYNIGRVAGLAAAGLDDPDAQAAKLLEAKTAYSNTLRTATAQTDPALLSLTYVALGRIYEFNNDAAYAMKLYESAIKIGDVSGGALGEATAGKQRLLKPQ